MPYFSLSLLFESFDAKTNQSRNSYEHRIVLVHFPENIEKNEIIHYCQAELKEETYQTADGDEVFWQVTKIIDVFELVETIPPIPTPLEVYSRYFADDGQLSRQEVLDKYFSDYVWQK